MANANTPYISKNAAPLVNPIVATPFSQVVPVTPNASVVQQVAYVRYAGYAAIGAGTSNNINNVRISIHASGRATGGGTTNFQPGIRIGSTTFALPALAAGFGTVVGATTATAFNTASGNWAIDASLLWDPNSGQINGTVAGFSGSNGTMTLTALTAITPLTGYTALSAQQNVTAVPSTQTGELQLFFAVTGLFSATNAGNIAYLDQFEVESL